MERDMFILMSADMSILPSDGAECKLASNLVYQVVVGLAWSVIFMLEYGGKTGGAVTTKLYGAGGDMILLNDCFDHNDDGVDSSNLCAVRVLIIWVSWSNVVSKDLLSALSPLLDCKPCDAKVVFV